MGEDLSDARLLAGAAGLAAPGGLQESLNE